MLFKSIEQFSTDKSWPPSLPLWNTCLLLRFGTEATGGLGERLGLPHLNGLLPSDASFIVCNLFTNLELGTFNLSIVSFEQCGVVSFSDFSPASKNILFRKL